MNRLFIILITILSSLLFSREDYNRIYLMEFENVSSDFTINNSSSLNAAFLSFKNKFLFQNV